jgi:RNA polymerase sigma factor (TIGR02999 family)
MSNISQLLSAVDGGDQDAAEQLLPVVYEELRRLASQELRHERPGHTLQPTALVHEAYLRLVTGSGQPQFKCRRYFFAAASQAMRRILVESARRKQTQRAGGELKRHEFVEDGIALPQRSEDLLALDEALQRLATDAPRKAQLVELRFFAGLTIAETAKLLEISTATAERDWTYARAWLRRELDAETDSEAL